MTINNNIELCDFDSIIISNKFKSIFFLVSENTKS